MAGLLGNPLGYISEITNESALDNAIQRGYYSVKTSIATTDGNKIVYGTMLVLASNSYVSQIAFGSEGLAVLRRYDVSTKTWDSWRNIGK